MHFRTVPLVLKEAFLYQVYILLAKNRPMALNPLSPFFWLIMHAAQWF